jgi:prolyl-tRNA synthetase
MRLGRTPLFDTSSQPSASDSFLQMDLTRFTDAGFPWFSPIGQRLMTRIAAVVRAGMERAGYAEFRGPAVSRIETIAPAGWLDKFGDELIGFDAPYDAYTLSPTSEEPLLAFIGRDGLVSRRQLPMRLFEFREIFRFRDRPQGIYHSRQFQCCLFASLDVDHDAYLISAEHAQSTIAAILRALDLHAELVTDKFTGGFEFIFPFERGDRPRSRTIPYHRDPHRLTTVDDDEPQGGLAMGYRYEHVERFDVRYRDADNQIRVPVMGTYGLGMQRCVVALAEQHRTAHGVAFPAQVRPFDVTVVPQGKAPEILDHACRIYQELLDHGINVALDDRMNLGLGQRLRFADTYGVPWRVVVGASDLAQGQAELRREQDSGYAPRRMPIQRLMTQLFAEHTEPWSSHEGVRV